MIDAPSGDEAYDLPRYERIAARERAHTIALIDDWPPEVQQDAIPLWMAIQAAVNRYVRRVDRALDERTLPMLLRMAADEHDRIMRAARDDDE